MANTMKAEGITGQIEVSNGIISITRKGLIAALSQGKKGELTISINHVTKVDYKKTSPLTNGHIHFLLEGEKEGSHSILNCPLTVIFNHKQEVEFEKIVQIVSELKDQVTQDIKPPSFSIKEDHISVEEDSIEKECPFRLAQGEKLILDTANVMYYGVGISNIGFFGGGTSNSMFGGVNLGVQTKRERSMWDSQESHVYLTSHRLVFLKAKISFISRKEKKLENVVSDIPLGSIERIHAGTKMLFPTVELSVKSQSGQMDNIVFAVYTIKDNVAIRDNWIKALEKYTEELPNILSNNTLAEDPLKILQIRYAKGEITKEEFLQMKKDLDG